MSMVAGRGPSALRRGGPDHRSLDIIAAKGPTNTEALARLDGHDRLLTPRGKLTRTDDVLEGGRLQISRNPEGEAVKPMNCGSARSGR